MKKLLMVLFLLLLCAVGIGFYRGWFALSGSRPDNELHQMNINLAIDTGKVQDDARLVRETTTKVTDKATEGTRSAGR